MPALPRREVLEPMSVSLGARISVSPVGGAWRCLWKRSSTNMLIHDIMAQTWLKFRFSSGASVADMGEMRSVGTHDCFRRIRDIGVSYIFFSVNGVRRRLWKGNATNILTLHIASNWKSDPTRLSAWAFNAIGYRFRCSLFEC